ncbi:histidine phosphotransferase family protein [Neptunicoccus sediminis]|uniref:histidine phosphotransferase family protein n=1 Tax=Neptunicoccus sediminis TaxID=1892596 RepID=UPI000B260144|nr:histidine phosphotransferase family protein [Neptunicoccus sediminis]
MYDTSDDITALISARICHDLASPLGAIANGVELLELSGVADCPEAVLLADSVNCATARMAFIRVAYGFANSQTKMAPSQAQQLLSANFAERKIAIQWRISQDTAKPLTKLLFLLIQCCESALPYGGEIQLHQRDDVIDLHTNAKEVRHDPALWGCLSAETAQPTLTSSLVHFELARLQALKLGRDIDVRFSDTTLDITIH